MHKWKSGDLRSGSKSGKKVTSQKQAVAIMLSEKRKADSGKEEYKSSKGKKVFKPKAKGKKPMPKKAKSGAKMQADALEKLRY